MVQIVCQFVGLGTWIAFGLIGWQTLLILIASTRRRRLLKKSAVTISACTLKQLKQLKNTDSGVTETASDERPVSGLWQTRIRQLADDFCRGDRTEARRRISSWCQENYFHADAVFLYSSLATRLGLFGTVIGIIAWFGGTTLHSADSISAVGFALVTTAIGLILATIIDISVSRIFEPAWQEFCAELVRSCDMLERRLCGLTVSRSGDNLPIGVPALSGVSPAIGALEQVFEDSHKERTEVSESRTESHASHRAMSLVPATAAGGVPCSRR